MKCIKNIGLLATALGNKALFGSGQGDIKKLKGKSVIIDGEYIADVVDSVPESFSGEIIDAQNLLVTPGLVDAHTHLVFGGFREHELQLKMQGVPYLDILARGGGILSTVKATRNSSEQELYEKAKKETDEMLKSGTTTCEAKSGYGLNLKDEIKQMRVVKRLNESSKMDIVSTQMAAHAVPEEYKNDREGYIRLVTDTIIPETKKQNLAEFVDVFCETGVFSVEESRRILLAAKNAGLKVKIHADEIDAIGGSELAGELCAASAEHLIAVDGKGISALKRGGSVACLLPATSFYLGASYAPARKLIQADVPVAIATDFNPGSCPCNSLKLCINLANYNYKMTPEEILTAVTLNAAAAIDRADIIGSIEKGKQADLVIWDAENLDYFCYRFGNPMVKSVIKKGEAVV